jgi:HSP20 family protein
MRDPFATLLSVQHALDNAMRSDWFGTRTAGRGAFPPVNVFRREEDFVIVAEMPGVRKEDLNIQLKGDEVRIRGRKSIDYGNDVSVHRRERTAGQFDRTLTLPARIDAGGATADYADGVLTLHLPRAESDKARSVTIS